MQIHIGCICLTFRHCAFANVRSKHIHKKIFNYTCCICLTFLDCALPFVLLNVWEYEDELEKSQHNIVILSVRVIPVILITIAIVIIIVTVVVTVTVIYIVINISTAVLFSLRVGILH